MFSLQEIDQIFSPTSEHHLAAVTLFTVRQAKLVFPFARMISDGKMAKLVFPFGGMFSDGKMLIWGSDVAFCVSLGGSWPDTQTISQQHTLID